MNMFTVVHIADIDRVISTSNTGELVNLELSANGRTKFIFEGTIYTVTNVVYNFASGNSTGERLMELLSIVTGNQERAADLIDRTEPLFRLMENEVSVRGLDDGTFAASTGQNMDSAACFVQAEPAYDGPRDAVPFLSTGLSDSMPSYNSGPCDAVARPSSGPRDC